MYEKITLPNGVRIAYEHIDHVRSVSVGIFVGVGSRFESASENGAAHYIEHMLFKGTQSRSASRLAFEMDAIGGQINACTTRDSTCFYARVLDSHLDRALDILCDMFFCSRFDEADVNSERGVILEEMDMYNDAPEDVVVERLLARCFPGALGRAIIGTEKSLSGLDSAALRGFKAREYTPDRIVVALCGSFDGKAIDSIAQRFSAMPVGSAKPPKKCAYKPAIYTKKKATEQNQICLGFEGTSVSDEGRFASQLMSTVLGGGMSSRLFQTVRERNGLCYSIYSFGSSFAETGIFGVATALDRKNDKRALALIRDELDKMRQDGVTEEELSRAREQAKSGIVIGLESTSARMNRLGYGELMLGYSQDTDDVIARYDAVTREDVLAAARQLLREGTLSFSAVGRLSPTEEYLDILK
jgi:predicted Zn-dependent peptidase